MTDIKITATTEDPSGKGVDVEGELLNFKGWTFSACVLPEPDFESDCSACNYGRVVDVTLFHEGKPYYSCPGDDYDHRNIPLTDKHYRMFDEIDRHFPPSPEERRVMLEEREAIIDGIVTRLFEIQRTEFADVSDLIFREALRAAAFV